MDKPLVIIESGSTDPAYNLALEEYIFDHMTKDNEYFWLWQNDNTIVVGKHQNTAQEINHEYVREHDIRVVRRLSGGGAVYHDMGNLNFTFIADAGNIEKLNLQTFCIPVVETLRLMGVPAQVSGRNDMTIGGRKFSGNSQYIKDGRIMHHGCMMFDSDLTVVGQALAVSEEKYKSKGFKSTKSRITNIRPFVKKGVTLQDFWEILTDHIAASASQVSFYSLTAEEEKIVEKIRNERYATWEWTFGYSPAFSFTNKKRFDGVGEIEARLDVKNGCIEGFVTYGDYFGDGVTEELQEKLCGCPQTEEAITAALSGFDLDACFKNLTVEDFAKLLIE